MKYVYLLGAIIAALYGHVAIVIVLLFFCVLCLVGDWAEYMAKLQ